MDPSGGTAAVASKETAMQTKLWHVAGWGSKANRCVGSGKATEEKEKEQVVEEKAEGGRLREQVRDAAQCLRRNEVVGFPTETVYGLGGNALSCEAIAKIFAAKGRPSDNPLIVHVATTSAWEELVLSVPPVARALADAFWPGPLTIVLPVKPGVSPLVTAGLSTVGVRIPSHPVALALLEEVGLPIAAPSANTSGKPSPTLAGHVMDDLAGRVSGVVDGGPTGVGLESTVVDCSGFCEGEGGDNSGLITILRPGGVTQEMLEELVRARFPDTVKVRLDPAVAKGHCFDHTTEIHDGLVARAPGMKYRHYAPHAELRLVDGSLAVLQKHVDAARGVGLGAADNKAEKEGSGLRVGVMVAADQVGEVRADLVVPCGATEGDLGSFATGLYEGLRAFDTSDIAVDLIFCRTLPSHDIGFAVMNRLMKAANGRVVS